VVRSAGRRESRATGPHRAVHDEGVQITLLSGSFGDQMLRSLFDHVLGLLGIG
jgi:hypothetical protein